MRTAVQIKTRASLLLAVIVLVSTACRSSGPAGGAKGPLVELAPEGQAYDLSLTMELRTGSEPPQRVAVSGVWQKVEPRSPAAEQTVAFRLLEPRTDGSDPSARAGQGLTDEKAQVFRETVSRPFLVSYTRGRPTRAHFSPQVPPAVRNVLLTVVAELPGAQPSMDAPTVTTERDLLGEHMAALRPEGEGRRIEKRKLKYLSLDAPASGGPTPIKTAASVTIQKSEWHLTFGPDGKLESLTGQERLKVETGLPSLAPEVGTTMNLRARGAFDARPLAAAVEAASSDLVATAIVTQKSDPGDQRRAADERLVAGAGLPELLAPLEATRAPDAGAAAGDVHAAVERLAAFVRLNPAAAGGLGARVRAASSPATAKSLVQGLGMADAPAARQVVVALIGDGAVERNIRIAALRSLAQTREPDAAVVGAVGALLDDRDAELRRAAVFAYGSLLSTWRRSDPKGAAPVLAALAGKLEGATTTPQRIAVLESLGNAADASTVPAVRKALDDKDPDVRAAAASALRGVKSPDVDGLLAGMMRRDPSPRVRAAVITSVSFRDPTSFADQLAELALNEPEGFVRSAAVSLLGRTLATSPRAEETLRAVAARDRKPEIRQLAKKLLDDRAGRTQVAGGRLAGGGLPPGR